MRLLFVLDQWPELSETFVVNELEALRRQGHEVRVQAARTAPHPNPEAPRDVDVALLGRGSLRDLLWLLARHPRECAADLAARRRRRRDEWVRPLRALAGPARRIEEGGDEHLHAHFAAGAALDAMRLSALTGRPYSVTAHAYDIFALPRNLREKLERAAAVFSGCDYNVVRLRALAPAANVHEVVMGVDAGTFERAGPLPQGRAVLAVGRLVEKKGFDVLVDAAALLEDVSVQIVGDGPLRDELARRVAASGAPSSCSEAGLLRGCWPRWRRPTCSRCRASSRVTAIATRCPSSSRRRWRWGCSSSQATRSACPSACWRRGATCIRRATPRRSRRRCARRSR